MRIGERFIIQWWVMCDFRKSNIVGFPLFSLYNSVFATLISCQFSILISENKQVIILFEETLLRMNNVRWE